jgi:DNA-binding GntR family transcriptional regulator
MLKLRAKAAQETGWNRSGGVLRESEIAGATQAERLAGAIVESVLSGEFAPGFRLDETALAERLGLGCITVS